MKVLVTGGRGFIGSHVMDELRVRGHEPTALDRSRDNGERVFLADVRDRDAVMQAVSVHDAVIHLAGVLGTQETVNDPSPSIGTNIMGAVNVFEAVRTWEVPCVDITLGNHFMNNPYSITKSTAERFALMANKEWGTRIAIVRAMNAYGPRQKVGPVKKLMPTLIMAALQDRPMTLYGDGSQVMDMVYVTDVAKILIDALELDHQVYDSIFEAGPGLPTTVMQITNQVKKTTGVDFRVVFQPMRPGETEGAAVVADPTTLEPLGWKASDFVSLEEGTQNTLEYYKP